MIRQLTEELTGGKGFKPPRYMKLTEHEASILGALYKSPGYLNRAQLHARLYVNEPETHPRIVQVYICRLRKVLLPRGIVIETKYGLGWRMTKESKKRLATLIEKEKQRDEQPVVPGD